MGVYVAFDSAKNREQLFALQKQAVVDNFPRKARHGAKCFTLTSIQKQRVL